ncbi:unnamed protein product, partial [marine sediment metagenome]
SPFASILPYVERVNGRTVVSTFDDYPTALKGLLGVIYIASRASRR